MTTLRWFRQGSAAASFALAALLLTSGWGLMAGYVPSSAEAFASVLYLRKLGGVGSFLRGVHFWAASALVVSGAFYLLCFFVEGRVAAARRHWWVGLGLYLLVLGFCFTGFLLPMDQNAYWGTLVRLGIVETVPLTGTLVADLLRGGSVLNASTLPRFYTLHVSVLPFVALVLILALRQDLGAALRTRPNGMRLLVLGAVVLGLTYVAAALVQAPLEPRAAPGDTEYVPRPEWYFLWLFQIGKYVEAVPWVQSVALPVAGLGLLFGLPFLKPGSPAGRAAAAGALVVAWVGLTGLARYQDRELPRKLSYEEALRSRADEIYRADCLSCHGESGKGDGSQSRAFDLDSRDFTSPEFWAETSPLRMAEAIRDGRGKDMPAFGKKLEPEEIEALVEYIPDRFGP